MRKVALLAAAALAAGLTGPARAGDRPVVAELFTSEGCSSCPPADALLGELARTRPDVLALAFHVTYWDRLGWPDPFSLAAATDRQRNYSATLGLDGMYTPQMVVDGVRDVVGSDRSDVLAALRAAAAAAPPPVPLRLVRTAGGISLEVGEGGAKQAAVLLVGYDRVHHTQVARGENAGRTLAEANIVRGIAHAADWRGAKLSLQTVAPAGEHVAAILQAPDGHIFGAVAIE
jgi:hypothetical protein